MRATMLILLVSLACLANVQAAEAPTPAKPYAELEQQVGERAASLNQQNSQWQQRLKQDIDEVKHNQQQLASRLAAKQQQLSALNQQLVELRAQKQQLTQDYQVAVDDMKLVQGAYQKAINSLSQQWQQSPTQLVEQQRRAALNSAKAESGFPSLTRLDTLITAAVTDMQLTGQVTESNAAISFADGSVSEQPVTVVGGLMAVSTTASPSFIAMSDTLPMAITPKSVSIVTQLAAWLDEQSTLLPMDLSQGRMLPSLANEQSVANWVEEGGEVLWPILILAALGLLIALWRAAKLFYWQPLGNILPARSDTVDRITQLDMVKQQMANQPRVPAATVLANSIVTGANVESMDQRLKQLMLKQMAQFERGLGFIALLAAMAPMLGLLGTVSGMIETFQSLTEFGNSDPKLLSQGISKALITTQAGLLVALPLLLLHYPLKRRAQSLSLNMEQQSALLLAINIERGAANVAR
ncbi:MotA/TolQ/ExbB proton channel family protein [Shewanella youngdeokensis]|uniref:MotA/TolQ/ExbB proton channel family protein n=1 Tax=Shewanella youngdeokensis TaxID=2999068 RepID=A0ABZ0JWA8_9GAMM|nr:MotA/TolQ/ExbB proton channel family protein [Shewanella sp. DAU334]